METSRHIILSLILFTTPSVLLGPLSKATSITKTCFLRRIIASRIYRSMKVYILISISKHATVILSQHGIHLFPILRLWWSIRRSSYCTIFTLRYSYAFLECSTRRLTLPIILGSICSSYIRESLVTYTHTSHGLYPRAHRKLRRGSSIGIPLIWPLFISILTCKMVSHVDPVTFTSSHFIQFFLNSFSWFLTHSYEQPSKSRTRTIFKIHSIHILTLTTSYH